MFVKDCEVQIERGGPESIRCDESKCSKVAFMIYTWSESFPPKPVLFCYPTVWLSVVPYVYHTFFIISVFSKLLWKYFN